MPGPLADDLYLVLHDPYTGKPRLPEGQLSTCLASALLCELMLGDHVRVFEGQLALVDRPPPNDPLGRLLLEQLERQVFDQPHAIADWLPVTRATAVAMVSERIVQSGRGILQERRRLGRTTASLVANDPAETELAADRLAAYLRNGMTPRVEEVVLAVLVMFGGPKPDPINSTAAARSFVIGLRPTLPPDVQLVLNRAERVLTSWR